METQIQTVPVLIAADSKHMHMGRGMIMMLTENGSADGKMHTKMIENLFRCKKHTIPVAGAIHFLASAHSLILQEHMKMNTNIVGQGRPGFAHTFKIPVLIPKHVYFGCMAGIPAGMRGDTIRHIHKLFTPTLLPDVRGAVVFADRNTNLEQYVFFLNKRYPHADVRLLTTDELNEMEPEAWSNTIANNDYIL